MSIIMVDYEDAFRRADKLDEFRGKCAVCAAKLEQENSPLHENLSDITRRLAELSADVRSGGRVWDEFYRANVRLD